MKNFSAIILVILYLLPFSLAKSQSNNASLPGWFFKTENYNRINMAVGISDPNPDTTLALEQAKLNALINYNLIHHGTFTSLTNVGMGSHQDDNNSTSNLEYILYTCIIKGKLPSLSSINVKEKYFTRYKEAVVLLEINNEAETSGVSPEYVLTRRAGFQKENNMFPLFADELDIHVTIGDSVVLSSGIESDGQKYIETKKGKKNRFYFNPQDLRMSMFYPDYNTISDQQGLSAMYSSLNYGLWKSYIFNLINQLCIFNNTDINFQYKLSTSNIGNINKSDKLHSFQQLVYSLKNFQSIKLNNSIEAIYFSNNQLFLGIKSTKNNLGSILPASAGKTDKKYIKKLQAEKWKSIDGEDIVMSWMKVKNLTSMKDAYIGAEIEIQASNLQSGIIEGLQLAKLQISSQLATKIKSLGQSETSSDNQLTIKSAKLINVEKTGIIEPYFVFYSNPYPNSYHIKVMVYYDLKQVDGF
jgi:hypothetical protein